jgi:hypothetical protein
MAVSVDAVPAPPCSETWRLVLFVRHIPALTPEEMRQIVVASGHEHGDHDAKR